MSNLDYPISVLLAKGKEISFQPVLPNKKSIEETNQLVGLDRAINILRSQKGRDENNEREIKEKL